MHFYALLLEYTVQDICGMFNALTSSFILRDSTLLTVLISTDDDDASDACTKLMPVFYIYIYYTFRPLFCIILYH